MAGRLALRGWRGAATLLVLLFAAMLFAVAARAASGPEFPELTGRVVDNANLIDEADQAAMTARLQAIEEKTGRQVVVATLPSLQGYDIADYGYQLGRHWQIGSKEEDDGLLILVAPEERKMRIEVGYGLEPYVTDALSSLIINNTMKPRFKDGDFVGGINGAIDEIEPQLELTPEQAQARIAQLEEDQATEDRVGFAIMIGFFLLFFVLPIVIASVRGKKYRGRGGPVVIWGPSAGGWGSNSSGWGGGGSSWGGGGGFGGGFSGGGGGFGGGGASGGW